MAMDYKHASAGLGWFSIALGAAELLAPRRISGALEAEGSEALIRAFGAREIAAGIAILNAPAHAARVGARVAGDALDLGALAVAARNAPRNPWVWGAIGFVLGATIADVLVTRGLAGPSGESETPGEPSRATSPEPAHTARALAQAVA
jgi:hypothetical protein